jgi:transposase-like protein
VPKPSRNADREISSKEGAHKRHEPSVNGASVESVQPKKRRRFPASEKLRLVKAAEAAVASGVRGALEALLRKEGIYSSHLSAWRQQLGAGGTAGLTPQKPGRKPKLDEKDRKLAAVTKENAVLKRKLQVANALIGLQKKAHEILGLALPEHDEES